MNIKELPGINKNINNVIKTAAPFWRILNEPSIGNAEKNMVVIFGNDMSTDLNAGFVKKDSYLARLNRCIEYVRKNFSGYDLCYKPHPNDEHEKDPLNLKDFRIIDEEKTAEIFLFENRHKIKAVFSIGSYSTLNAYYMGLNSHAFYEYFRDVYLPELIWNLASFHFGMPPSFFINDLSQATVDNSRILEPDDLLVQNLKNHLAERSGKIWLICSFSGSLVILASLARIIKDLSPGRKIGLIINRSRRFDKISTDCFRNHFDEIVFLPRILYSLRPSRLLEAIKTAWQIKNFKISPGDILIADSQPEFVENCFVSYHKKNLRIGILLNRDFYAQYNNQNLFYTKSKSGDFRFNKATWFYNKIFEPILGLHRTLSMVLTRSKDFHARRYQEPINQVFDELFLFSPGLNQ